MRIMCLKAMFYGGYWESQREVQEIKIKDTFEPIIFQNFIKFFYGAEIVIEWSNFGSLLRLACYYQNKSLLEHLTRVANNIMSKATFSFFLDLYDIATDGIKTIIHSHIQDHFHEYFSRGLLDNLPGNIVKSLVNNVFCDHKKILNNVSPQYLRHPDLTVGLKVRGVSVKRTTVTDMDSEYASMLAWNTQEKGKKYWQLQFPHYGLPFSNRLIVGIAQEECGICDPYKSDLAFVYYSETGQLFNGGQQKSAGLRRLGPDQHMVICLDMDELKVWFKQGKMPFVLGFDELPRCRYHLLIGIVSVGQKVVFDQIESPDHDWVSETSAVNVVSLPVVSPHSPSMSTNLNFSKDMLNLDEAEFDTVTTEEASRTDISVRKLSPHQTISSPNMIRSRLHNGRRQYLYESCVKDRLSSMGNWCHRITRVPLAGTLLQSTPKVQLPERGETSKNGPIIHVKVDNQGIGKNSVGPQASQQNLLRGIDEPMEPSSFRYRAVRNDESGTYGGRLGGTTSSISSHFPLLDLTVLRHEKVPSSCIGSVSSNHSLVYGAVSTKSSHIGIAGNSYGNEIEIGDRNYCPDRNFVNNQLIGKLCKHSSPLHSEFRTGMNDSSFLRFSMDQPFATRCSSRSSDLSLINCQEIPGRTHRSWPLKRKLPWSCIDQADSSSISSSNSSIHVDNSYFLRVTNCLPLEKFYGNASSLSANSSDIRTQVLSSCNAQTHSHCPTFHLSPESATTSESCWSSSCLSFSSNYLPSSSIFSKSCTTSKVNTSSQGLSSTSDGSSVSGFSSDCITNSTSEQDVSFSMSSSNVFGLQSAASFDHKSSDKQTSTQLVSTSIAPCHFLSVIIQNYLNDHICANSADSIVCQQELNGLLNQSSQSITTNISNQPYIEIIKTSVTDSPIGSGEEVSTYVDDGNMNTVCSDMDNEVSASHVACNNF